ncbi:YdiU family protein [Clostridium sp. YIM B02555]|uniref:protein adenylyltransferase SelO n=1 Tax=Clostridium sp. YIM B02555 TaxID=2911968 RepID=UPI001EED5300|nr:YdiU family protein [Clostridium sp. YIM B02555]
MDMTKTKINIGWNFDNSYARLPDVFFTKQSPDNVPSPKLIIFNHSLALSLGLNEKTTENIEVFAGNTLPEGAQPIAQAYGGHQYGYFNMLGDGRAVLLGEQITPLGERFDIQLKGSGRTRYSRRGDGKAALGPMLREYIISEAMHGLGIPTTRSLAVVTTGESVFRENILKGAVLTRIAASHIRVGTFQYAREWCKVEDLKALADYTLKRHFSNEVNYENKYLFLLQEVIKRQALLIAKWQLVGFVHGVMNTDNVSISGETIDYGPCAFMDNYDPATVFSSIDSEGRYAYGNQPYIAAWNLARFAETLLPLLNNDKEKAIQLAENALSNFAELYQNNYQLGMRHKLGIFNEEPEDNQLIKELLSIMYKYGADYTNTFRELTLHEFSNTEMFKSEDFDKWYEKWQEKLNRQMESKDSVQKLMKNSNPAVIPRNYRVEEALEAAEKHEDYSVMEKLLSVISKPYDYSIDQIEYTTLPKKSACNYRTFCGT